MDYTRFTTEEFVFDDYFRRWINQQLPAEDDFWEKWLSQHPEKQDEVSQARFVLEALKMERIEPEHQRMADRIQMLLDSLPDKPAETRSGVLYSLWFRVAAILVLASGLGWYLISGGGTNDAYDYLAESSVPASIEKINNSAEPIKVSLSDGSVITLQPRSGLRYPEVFASDKREVYLVGEARFDVTKDALRPFLVHSNELVTKVLGTSFSIRAYQNDRNITVKVYTGKVSVLAGKESGQSIRQPFNQNEGVILTPNQMAVFDREPERLTKTLVENPAIISPPAERSSGSSAFLFNNAPVEKVFETLEKSYGVSIVYDREVLNNCTVTAPLGDETLYEKLDLVCKVIRASYEVVDAQIIISSKGCM